MSPNSPRSSVSPTFIVIPTDAHKKAGRRIREKCFPRGRQQKGSLDSIVFCFLHRARNTEHFSFLFLSLCLSPRLKGRKNPLMLQLRDTRVHARKSLIRFFPFTFLEAHATQNARSMKCFVGIYNVQCIVH